MPAHATEMCPLTERLFFDAIALRTPLRRLQPARRRFHEQRSSFFRFVSQHGEECGGTSIEYFSIEASLLSDVLSRLLDCSFGRPSQLADSQLLSRDQSEPLDQPRAGLMMEVQPPPSVLRLQFSTPDNSLTAVHSATL